MTIFHHSFHNFFLLITYEKIYEGKKSNFFLNLHLPTEYIKNVTKDKFLFLHDLSANSSGRDSN